MNCVNLGGLPEDVYNYFDGQAGGNFLHSFYAPPVCLEQWEDSFQKVKTRRFEIPFLSIINKTSAGVTHLIVVAFGEEQGTQLAVQGRLVGLVAMFG